MILPFGSLRFSVALSWECSMTILKELQEVNKINHRGYFKIKHY